MISPVSFCLQFAVTEEASMMWNWFPCKTPCEQIFLCCDCGLLLLKYGYVHSESMQSNEDRASQTDLSKAQQKTQSFLFTQDLFLTLLNLRLQCVTYF